MLEKKFSKLSHKIEDKKTSILTFVSFPSGLASNAVAVTIDVHISGAMKDIGVIQLQTRYVVN